MSSKLALVVAYGIFALSICVGFWTGYQLGRGYCFVRGGRKIERHKGVLFFRSRNIRWMMIWFAILIGLLVVNITGCRDMIHAH